MSYSIRDICSAINGRFIATGPDSLIDELVTDSRRIVSGEHSVFFAISTIHNNGHRYLQEAYARGVRNLVVSEDTEATDFPEANIIQVDDTLRALQRLARFHRSHFKYPVIGITGSNGKTVVKEWLYQLLADLFVIVRSPRSYNSQIGVPLSVWQMNADNTLGIFEAGISRPGEMAALEPIITPDIGIITNLGQAHDEGFDSPAQKLEQKFLLFKNASIVIGPCSLLKNFTGKGKKFSWGPESNADLQITSTTNEGKQTVINAVHKGKSYSVKIPFTDAASIENAITCLCVVLQLKADTPTVIEAFSRLHPVDMRLQLKQGMNGCLVINDSYSADLTSLRIALDFLQQQSSGLKRTLILSDFLETGLSDTEFREELMELLFNYRVEKLLLVGSKIPGLLKNADLPIETHHFTTTEDLLSDFRISAFNNEVVLIKGARRFAFERIVSLFERKQHQTVLEVNLNALVHNLKEYQRRLNVGTKVMAMVKAFSYGSGGAEIASVLQFHNVHYLGVAYADEGAELRRAGISMPIMVMNAEPSSFQLITEQNLQPVIFSESLLQQFTAYLDEQGLSAYPVHIEIETGMNRLGFSLDTVQKLGEQLRSTHFFKVQSIFSHLAASEDPAQDAFTGMQASTLEQASHILSNKLGYSFLTHIANSAAIIRHPQLQMDMVRLGIGLYGVEVDPEKLLDLHPVATLRSTVAQLHKVPAGGSVSYNRRGVVTKDSIIATIRIGYADGYSRAFGQGRGHVWINGSLAPVIGTVCMDMTMIDVTGLDVKEGDPVIIFGKELPVEEVAGWIGTIPYELMTSVSQRVKRVYFHE